jgi:hypothetical protein
VAAVWTSKPKKDATPLLLLANAPIVIDGLALASATFVLIFRTASAPSEPVVTTCVTSISVEAAPVDASANVTVYVPVLSPDGFIARNSVRR